MNPPTYDLAFFKALFSAIPDSLWCVDVYIGNDGQRCAQGHVCDVSVYNPFMLVQTDMFRALLPLFEPLRCSLPETIVHRITGATERAEVKVVGTINNGYHPLYQQPTPRLRILTAIEDLMAMSEATHAAAQPETVSPSLQLVSLS